METNGRSRPCPLRRVLFNNCSDRESCKQSPNVVLLTRLIPFPPLPPLWVYSLPLFALFLSSGDLLKEQNSVFVLRASKLWGWRHTQIQFPPSEIQRPFLHLRFISTFNGSTQIKVFCGLKREGWSTSQTLLIMTGHAFLKQKMAITGTPLPCACRPWLFLGHAVGPSTLQFSIEFWFFQLFPR